MPKGRRLAITDIHACPYTLKELLYTVLQIKIEDELFFLGDYISKGPDADGVLDVLLDLWEGPIACRFLKGNHEDMLLEERRDFGMTRGAFSLADADRLFVEGSRYKAFLDQLEYYIELDNSILVHGGIDYRKADPFDPLQSILWARATHYDEQKAKGKRIVHGHTPHLLSELEENIKAQAHVLNLDTGCVYHGKPGMGYLVALDLDTLELYKQEYIG